MIILADRNCFLTHSNKDATIAKNKMTTPYFHFSLKKIVNT